MDPHVKNFEILKEEDHDVVLKTGFEATFRRREGAQIPYFESFKTDTIEKIEVFRFDDPWDDRRYFSGGDNQIAGIGDVISRNSPPWIDTVKSIHPDFPVYGSILEGHEAHWRIVGSENAFMWMALYPEDLGRFIERLGTFLIEMTKAQIKAADGSKPGFWETLRKNALELRARSDRAIMVVVGCNLFEWGTFLRRIDNFLADPPLEPDKVESLPDALMERHLAVLE